tara:strand:+ start:380 stop:622 length:243 start_codon:yes stop_codon:yes gene_type:complete
MSWYLMAVVMFAGSIVPDFKINTALKFPDEPSCIEYVNLYEDQLKGGLIRAFPDTTSTELICVDQETALRMQGEMIRRSR